MRHNVKHIVNDIPGISYFRLCKIFVAIYIDMPHKQFEVIADSAIIYMGGWDYGRKGNKRIRANT